jgi:hypothetical protein
VRSLLTRTAFSVLGVAALASTAAAQQAIVRPWPGSANAFQPMPASNQASTSNDPFASAPAASQPGAASWNSPAPYAIQPQSPGSVNTMGWTTTGQAGASTQPIHTLFYRKETESQKSVAPPLEPARRAPTGGIRLAQATNVPEQAPAPRLEENFRPTREELFLLDSEAAFVQRENNIRRRDDARLAKDLQRPVVIFPPHEGATNRPFQGRSFQPSLEQIEPNYVVYGRLFFEDKNTERYGWEMGALQPYYSAWKFLSDAGSMPYKIFSFPRLNYDSNAGLCLPGDPMPMLWYPPEISISGLTAQTIWNVTWAVIIH